MNTLEIKYRWADLQTSVGINYQYPSALSAFMREQYCRPSVYRWIVWTPTVGFSGIYVGETDNLARRIQQYLSPGHRQATNVRLKAFFDNGVKRNERVELQTLDFEPFQVNKLTFSIESLGDTHIRRILESFILAELQASSQTARPVILNQVFVQNAARRKKRVTDAKAALRKLGLTERAAAFEQALQCKIKR